MSPATRAALETTLRRSVIAATPEQAQSLRDQAQGMLSALLNENILSPIGYAAEKTLIDLARAQREEIKGTGK